MIVSIEREKVFTLEGHDEVRITYKVPTAEDFEKLISTKPGDCDVFNTFALKVEGITDEAGTPYRVEDIAQLPGSWPIVTGLAKAVMEAATLGIEGKNG